MPLILRIRLACVSIVIAIFYANSLLAADVINKPGVFLSPKAICEATLKVNEMGGFISLLVQNNFSKVRSNEIRDVTGIVWLAENKLIYTVSPIYGKPGIFLLNCTPELHITRILGPKTIDKTYPDGADYFELQGLSDGKPNKVFFYYGSDVDKIDFNNIRTGKYLHQVSLDGTGFKKAK